VYPKPGDVWRAFVLRTTGGAWARSATPVVPNPVYLLDVDCATANDCSAIGAEHLEGNDEAPPVRSKLLRTTNGTSWFSPAGTAERPRWDYAAVSCPSPSACVAVGSYRVNPDRYVGLIAREG
jgi:hypothetical protein